MIFWVKKLKNFLKKVSKYFGVTLNNFEFFDSDFTSEEAINSMVPKNRLELIEDY